MCVCACLCCSSGSLGAKSLSSSAPSHRDRLGVLAPFSSSLSHLSCKLHVSPGVGELWWGWQAGTCPVGRGVALVALIYGAGRAPSTWIWIIAGLGGTGEQEPASRDKEGPGCKARHERQESDSSGPGLTSSAVPALTRAERPHPSPPSDGCALQSTGWAAHCGGGSRRGPKGSAVYGTWP